MSVLSRSEESTVRLWVPRIQDEPAMTTSERLLSDRLIRASTAAAKYELALRMILAASHLEAHCLAEEALRP